MPHFINLFENVYSSSLTRSFWLANEYNSWLWFRWFWRLGARSRISWKDCYWSLFVFLQELVQFLLIVFIYIVEICWVKPGNWEKIEVTFSWKLLFKSSQMYTESVFPRYIIHTQEMIDPLPWKQSAEPLWCEASIVKPVDVPRAHFVSLAKIVTFCR